jgi:hypothetical protein
MCGKAPVLRLQVEISESTIGLGVRDRTMETILLDLDRHRVVDLLANRSVETFRGWLEQHPGVAVVARERSGAYAEAASLGAPESRQVADRFHLLLNLSAAVERAFEERSHQLLLPPPSEPEVMAEAVTPVMIAAPTTQQLAKLQRRERRLTGFQQVIELHRGHSVSAISRVICLERKTIRRWIRAGQFPERKRPVRPRPKVHAFADHLQRRWAERCRSHEALPGDSGIGISRRPLKSRAIRFRVAKIWKAGDATPCPKRVAPKHATILVTRPPDQLSPSQQLLLDRLIDWQSRALTPLVSAA